MYLNTHIWSVQGSSDCRSVDYGTSDSMLHWNDDHNVTYHTFWNQTNNAWN